MAVPFVSGTDVNHHESPTLPAEPIPFVSTTRLLESERRSERKIWKKKEVMVTVRSCQSKEGTLRFRRLGLFKVTRLEVTAWKRSLKDSKRITLKKLVE